ncbi:MAG: UvrD-helicase domain-containing protein [Acidobacteriota bacterium]
MTWLDELNPEQRAAAAHEGGPMLILAGAGSGKTRVITYRIAHLLASGAHPGSILALTFTNKAAREMRERVLALLDRAGYDLPAPWMGTFHGCCLRLLRAEVDEIELTPGFVVLDQDDARALVKACQRELGVDDRTWLPRRVLSRISRAKADCLDPKAFARKVDGGDELDEAAAKVYPLYQERLVQSNACDFDDLLMRCVRLFEVREDIRDKYRERLSHLLIDEYQDTNPIQYRLIKLLCGENTTPCAVGDEDQSIYRFRGADIQNILSFEKDFAGTTVYRVERNYRSSGNILEAANALVACNRERKGKRLWTDAEEGEPITLAVAESGVDEAEWVADLAQRWSQEHGLGEVAVTYRTNVQSRQFEEAFTRRGIPHVVVGGMRFYERREIKDLLSYLRLSLNPNDDLAVDRVLNVPPRGIGRGAREAIFTLARERRCSLYDAIQRGVQDSAYPPRVERALDRFIDLVESLRKQAPELRVAELIELVIDESNYIAYLEKEGEAIAKERASHLQELVAAATDHERRAEIAMQDPDSEDEGGLAGFLADVALSSETDELGGEKAQLMTLHAAKGLEFDCVFLTGLEEGLLPHGGSLDELAALEEERRLCYVGVTRAKKRLWITHARMRRVFGELKLQDPSRFLDELPPELLKHEAIGGGGRGSTPRRKRRLGSSQQQALASFFGDEQVPTEDYSQESPDDEFETESAPAEEDEVPARQVDDEPEMTAPEPVAAPAAPAPAAAGPVDPRKLKKGDLVRHGRFGVGTVLGFEGGGKTAKINVYFAGRGRVKLVCEHARLEPMP